MACGFSSVQYKLFLELKIPFLHGVNVASVHKIDLGKEILRLHCAKKPAHVSLIIICFQIIISKIFAKVLQIFKLDNTFTEINAFYVIF